jgi:large subunit ribosomal protein L1
VPQHGKKYEQAVKLVDPKKYYAPEEGVALAKQAGYAKFDETLEVHLRTGLDPRHADQNVRGTAQLPHGLGKTVRVLVFDEGEAARNAEQAGADLVGGDELIKRVSEGYIDFDVALATRDMMGKIGRLGRVLGPRGLMPNPRTGTVVEGEDIVKAVNDARAGRVEFRTNKEASMHVPVGKLSFSEDALLGNIATVVNAIVQAKPSGAKGQYIRAVTIASTMGPGIHLDLTPTLALKAS